MRSIRLMFVLGAILLPFVFIGVVASAPPSPKHPKLAGIVSQLVEASDNAAQDETTPSAQAQATPDSPINPYIDTGLMRFDELGRVQLYIHLNIEANDSILDDISANGAEIELIDGTNLIVQVSVQPDDITSIASFDAVKTITLPLYGHADIGSQLAEGDALLDFDDLRTTYGIDGTGVTIGVISDGIFGLADAIALGDLPATSETRDTGKLISTSGGVIAESHRADNNLEAGLSGGLGAEGTAILEIVHDIAPGAQLRFANFDTSLSFNAAVNSLASQSDIVIDDIGWFGAPYDQSSSISTNTAAALNLSTNPIRGYYTSVGNQADQHYQEIYQNSGVDGSLFVPGNGNLHRFQATTDTTDCMTLGSQVSNPVFLNAGSSGIIFMNWDDTFGAASTDYDIFVLDNDTGFIVGAGIDDNVFVTGQPRETVAFTNSTGGGKFYDILIQNFEDTSAPKTFDMFVFGTSFLGCASGPNTQFNFNTMASSVPAQSDAGGGVVSVGAISASDPGSDDIETFSSHGPANNGALKPDVSAIDGVSVTGSGGFGSPFFGTSASAPHVAAMAGLLLELQPDLQFGETGDDPAADRTALRDAITGTSVDLGAPGADNVFGHGRVNGLSAGAAVAPEPDPTPTPTPTPEPVPSMSTWGLFALAGLFGFVVFMRMRRQRSPNWLQP